MASRELCHSSQGRGRAAPPLRSAHERRGEDDRLAVVVERDPEQREVARRNVEGVAEDVVDAARVGGVPRAGDDIGEKNSISR